MGNADKFVVTDADIFRQGDYQLFVAEIIK